MVVRRWTHYYSCTCGLYVEGTGTIYQRSRRCGDARTPAVIRMTMMRDNVDPLQEAASTESAQIIRSQNDTVERHFWLLTNAIQLDNHLSNHVSQLYQYVACCLRICRLCVLNHVSNIVSDVLGKCVTVYVGMGLVREARSSRPAMPLGWFNAPRKISLR